MSDDRERQFLDTNVLIYAHDTSAGRKHDRARALMHELWQSGDGCLSVQVLQEFYVNVTAKVPKPLAPETASDRIAELATWPIHRPGVEDVLDAIRLATRYGVSFWDAMVIQSATQLGCRRLWSEDLGAGQVYGSLRVVDPFSTAAGETWRRSE